MAVRINGYLIDAALNEIHSYPSEVTSFPVEQGSDLTDHIRDNPIEVEIDGIVSDTPIGSVALERENEVAEAGEELEFLPSDEAIARLLRIRDRKPKQTVTIQTSRRLYENMAMENLDIPVDPKTGMALRFTARFRQITTVTNLRTTIRTATPAGKKKTKLGPHPELAAVRRAGGKLVFTVKRGAPKPDFVVGNLSDHYIALADDVKKRDHYLIEDHELYRADGYVLKGKYHAFRESILMPRKGGMVLTDTTGKIWHQYTFNRQEVDQAAAENAADTTDVSDLAGPDPDPEGRWEGVYGD